MRLYDTTFDAATLIERAREIADCWLRAYGSAFEPAPALSRAMLSLIRLIACYEVAAGADSGQGEPKDRRFDLAYGGIEAAKYCTSTG